jgi:L-fuconolactonase
MTRNILDAHVHVWKLIETPQDWIEPVSMSAIARDFTVADAGLVSGASGVDACVLVQTENSLSETLGLLEAAAAGHIHGVIGWADLAGDCAAGLDLLENDTAGKALVGIRHLAHIESDEQWLLRPSVRRGLNVLAERGIPFDVVIRPWQLPLAVELARLHPTLPFVLDHLGNPPIGTEHMDRWSAHIVQLAACENVVAKISGLSVDSDPIGWTTADLKPVIDIALENFGPDRLMFGSDFPLVELVGGYVRWVDAYVELTGALSAGEQDEIDCGTAQRIYRRKS